MPLIVNMFLKSENFRYYNELSKKVNECTFRVSEEILCLDERDDSFSITVRELRRITSTSGKLL